MERGEAQCVQVGLRHHGPKTRVTRCRGVQVHNACSEVRGPETGTESPHAAATPMMARMRKWTARCPAVGTLSATMVFCSVLVSFFCLVLVVFSILTWNEPNLLCRAKT